MHLEFIRKLAAQWRDGTPALADDPLWTERIRTLSRTGLQNLALVEIAAVLLALRWWQVAGLAAVALATLVSARTAPGRGRPRVAACISILAVAGILAAVPLLHEARPGESGGLLLAGLSVLLVAGVGVVPFEPRHVLSLGISIEGLYILATVVSPEWGFPGFSPAQDVFLPAVAVIAAVLSATRSRLRRMEFQTNQEAVRVAEALASAQLRAELAENAISIGKMAATLSHEINSPLGTLRSSIDTLVALTDRQIRAAPEQSARLADTREKLLGAINASAARIDSVAVRVRRFVALDEAELKVADINELLSDVALLHQEELSGAGAQLEFDLQPGLPRLNCRPQLLSAAFAALLTNAIQALDGSEKRRIGIATRGQEAAIEVIIRDSGRGMCPEEVTKIFDPGFKIAGKRVAGSNWSLFNTRQIFYEHGGEIRLESVPGEGTAFFVTLPAAV